MSRKKRFIHGIVSSYALIGLNVIYTLGTVPLALHYLNPQEFGLWALVTQISGYLLLLEFGMSGSVARFLADHKDDVDGGTYGSILKTGHRVFAIQGLVIALAGVGLSLVAPALFKIPAHLSHDFTCLLFLQTTLTGINLACRGFGTPLWSHQRLDISNLSGSLCLLVNFIALWLGFHLGWKLYSMLISTITGMLIGITVSYVSCRHLGLYPTKASQGSFDQSVFRELFGFGSGIFLMNIGSQLISTSQVMIISRVMGVESAAIWAIGTKISTMAQQFVGKILDSSAGGLAEMVVRKEQSVIWNRFRDVVSLTGVLALTTAIGIALLNGPFIVIWTSGKIHWDASNNLLLGILAFTTAVTRCHAGLTGISKHIGGMKYVYLVEGTVFVIMAYGLSRHFGFAGVLISSITCNLIITGQYVISRTAKYFQRSKLEVFSWTGRSLSVLILVIVAFFTLEWLDPQSSSTFSYQHFSLRIFIVAFTFTPILSFYALSSVLRKEISRMAFAILGKKAA
jgi:O-antigen/teichoic acid export membrane protein